MDANCLDGYAGWVKSNGLSAWHRILGSSPACFSLVAGLAAIDIWPSGCRSSFVALSPVAVVVPADRVWSAAQYYASLRPNAIVVKGDGDGMQPLYASGTVLVVEADDYRTLREGMSVMFRDPRGIRLVHFLLRRKQDGWATLGLNQGDQEDSGTLNRDNYLGTVIMAFSPAGSVPAMKPQ